MDRAAHFGWGLHAVERLRGRVGALVVVDVLSFSTAVDVAVTRGAQVMPMAPGDGQALPELVRAKAEGAMVAVRRGEPGYSLSPASLTGIEEGVRLILPSPNGARLSAAAVNGAAVFAGCLRNACAVAQAALEAAGQGDVGVVAAGEHWPGGEWRFAIEDLLGAGAVLHELGLAMEGEAGRACDAFRACGAHVGEFVRGSISGRELIGRGYPGDVDLAVEQDVSRSAPRLVDGAYRAA